MQEREGKRKQRLKRPAAAAWLPQSTALLLFPHSSLEPFDFFPRNCHCNAVSLRMHLASRLKTAGSTGYLLASSSWGRKQPSPP